MRDCNGELTKLPCTIKHGTLTNCPCMAIGTYQRTYEELCELLSSYPYDTIMLDTAYRYGNEAEVGDAVRTSGYPANKIIYIGKICYEQQRRGRSVADEVTETLKRLRIYAIDFYLIHSPRYEGFVNTWIQMIDLKKKGLIQNIGVSNFGEKEIATLYEKTGVIPSVNQITYNPFIENIEEKKQLIKYCQMKGIDIEIAMPFGGSEKKNSFSDFERKDILTSLYNLGLISVVGTKSKEHMLQNFRVFEELAKNA